MGADHQLVDQPAEMLAVDAVMRQRLLVGADAAHVLQPVLGGLAGEALGAVLEHARGGGALWPSSSPNTSAKMAPRSTAAPLDCATCAGSLPFLRCRLVGRPRRGDAEVDVAQRRVGDLQRARPARRTAAAGCRSARPRSTVCTRSRFLARASPSAALWKPARRSTRRRDLDLELAAHLGALDRRIADRDQAVHQVGHAAVVGPERLVPGARRDRRSGAAPRSSRRSGGAARRRAGRRSRRRRSRGVPS